MADIVSSINLLNAFCYVSPILKSWSGIESYQTGISGPLLHRVIKVNCFQTVPRTTYPFSCLNPLGPIRPQEPKSCSLQIRPYFPQSRPFINSSRQSTVDCSLTSISCSALKSLPHQLETLSMHQTDTHPPSSFLPTTVHLQTPMI